MDVFRGTRNFSLQFLWIILHTRVVQFVLEGHGTKFGHSTLYWGLLGSLIDLLGEVYDLLAIEKDGLMWMVGGHVRRRDLWQRGWARDPHQALLAVESEDLRTNSLDARIEEVKAIFARVDVRDDAVIDIDEGFLGVLDRQKHTIKKLGLVHLIRRQADHGLLFLATLHVNGELAVLVAHCVPILLL